MSTTGDEDAKSVKDENVTEKTTAKEGGITKGTICN